MPCRLIISRNGPFTKPVMIHIWSFSSSYDIFIFLWMQWVLEISDKPGITEPEPAFKVTMFLTLWLICDKLDYFWRLPVFMTYLIFDWLLFGTVCGKHAWRWTSWAGIGALLGRLAMWQLLRRLLGEILSTLSIYLNPIPNFGANSVSTFNTYLSLVGAGLGNPDCEQGSPTFTGVHEPRWLCCKAHSYTK